MALLAWTISLAMLRVASLALLAGVVVAAGSEGMSSLLGDTIAHARRIPGPVPPPPVA